MILFGCGLLLSGPGRLPRYQAGASAAATRGAYSTRSRLKVDDSEGFTVGWRAPRRAARRAAPRAEITAPC